MMTGEEVVRASLGGLGEEDYQLHLGVQEVGGGVDGEVASAFDGLPVGAGLLDGEVLVAELDGDRAGWGGYVLQAEAGQGVADEGFDLVGGAGF
jgi:hypothetical protein